MLKIRSRSQIILAEESSSASSLEETKQSQGNKYNAPTDYIISIIVKQRQGVPTGRGKEIDNRRYLQVRSGPSCHNLTRRPQQLQRRIDHPHQIIIVVYVYDCRGDDEIPLVAMRNHALL
eukprot:scaffold56_cov20-Prasinocladus_malaysianus.AAC.2